MPGASEHKEGQMRIEVLYVPGCRNYEPAVERLRKVLASQSVRDKVITLPVGTPA
jgi:hypothetical protein